MVVSLDRWMVDEGNAKSKMDDLVTLWLYGSDLGKLYIS